MPVITDKYQWIAANIIQSSIDGLNFEEIVPIEEDSMPKSVASHSLMLGLNRMKLMHFNNNVVSLVKILTDVKCNVYHYQLVTFHARGGFNLLHMTFKHAMTILFASDASVNKDENEKSCQLVDIFNKINDFEGEATEKATHEIASNLKKIETNFKKCNRQAALNYIDLYLSLLDKLTDCQEVLNSKYPLPDKHYDSFIIDDEKFEAEDETEQLKHEKSRDVVKKKPHTIVPLVVRNLHNQAFQTVQDLIKNKIIMDDNSIAPSVLNLLTNHIKGEKIIKEKMSLPALTQKKKTGWESSWSYEVRRFYYSFVQNERFVVRW
jgi:hypothetical protein